jgi:hypothetical protein
VCDWSAGEWCGTCGDCQCTSSCNGDGVCQTERGETFSTCAADCRTCNGNSKCEPGRGETPQNCARDCSKPTPAPRFGDLANHPARHEIEELTARNVIAGFPDGYFHPNAEVTRAQFATMVARAFLTGTAPASTGFTDLPPGHWAIDAVARAIAGGFMSGDADGSFKPDAAITRQEALSALSSGRRLAAAPFSAVQTRFGDAAEVAAWARDAVAAAEGARLLVNQELLRATGGTPLRLRPLAPATRAEVASFIFYGL